MVQFPRVFCLWGFIVSVMTQSTQRRRQTGARQGLRCGFPSMKTICNFGFNKKFNPVRQRNTFCRWPQTHWPGLWEKGGERQQTIVKVAIFLLNFESAFFTFQDILSNGRLLAHNPCLPASINCVYSFNEFMCLWCGLKVKLIPDAERETEGCSALLLAEREIHKILWKNIVNNLLSKLLRVKTLTLLRWRNPGCSNVSCAVI